MATLSDKPPWWWKIEQRVHRLGCSLLMGSEWRVVHRSQEDEAWQACERLRTDNARLRAAVEAADRLNESLRFHGDPSTMLPPQVMVAARDFQQARAAPEADDGNA